MRRIGIAVRVLREIALVGWGCLRAQMCRQREIPGEVCPEKGVLLGLRYGVCNKPQLQFCSNKRYNK